MGYSWVTPGLLRPYTGFLQLLWASLGEESLLCGYSCFTRGLRRSNSHFITGLLRGCACFTPALLRRYSGLTWGFFSSLGLWGGESRE